MKLNRVLLALLLITSLVVAASAQTVGRKHGRRATMTSTSNPQALAALQKDLQAAIQSMTSALPIYDGDRVRSIHAAHHALILVDVAISGASATKRAKPKVKDSIASKHAHTKYSQQQIAQSQSAMQQGLASLNAAVRDYQGAAGAHPNKAGEKVYTHIQTSISEATKAIARHGSAA